jgi:hypothetical protein
MTERVGVTSVGHSHRPSNDRDTVRQTVRRPDGLHDLCGRLAHNGFGGRTVRETVGLTVDGQLG